MQNKQSELEYKFGFTTSTLGFTATQVKQSKVAATLCLIKTMAIPMVIYEPCKRHISIKV